MGKLNKRPKPDSLNEGLHDSENDFSTSNRNKVGVLRQGYRLNRYEKLVLQEAIGFGLSHYCAGQIFGVPSVSRIVRDRKA